MRTDITKIEGSGNGMELALNRTEGLADVLNLNRTKRLYLRLLAEEMFGMVKAVAGNFTANYWAEGEDDECSLVLDASTALSPDAAEELISVTPDYQNTPNAGMGIMTKIWYIYMTAIHNFMDLTALDSAASRSGGDDELLFGKLGRLDLDKEEAGEPTSYAWSLNQYRENVAKGDTAAILAARDELEKSIIANIATDVKVGIVDNSVRMIITLKAE